MRAPIVRMPPIVAAHPVALLLGGADLLGARRRSCEVQRLADLRQDAGSVDPLLPPQVADRAVMHEPLVQRDLEQCTCYSNDLIDSLKAFFQDKNMDRTFNVPTFVRVVDNRGNEFHLNPSDQTKFVDVRATGKGDLYPGDELVIEVEVDQSFSGYTVWWVVTNGDRSEGSIARLTIEPKHVGVQVDVRFEVVSSEQWHKLLGCDDRLDLRYRVLPPVKE